jgi:sugar lactone lactonase YvrE
MTDIQCVVEAKALLGESTCWDARAQCLWWVDIFAQAIHRYEPAIGRTQMYATAQRPGSLAVRSEGSLVLAMGAGFHFFDPASGEFRHLVDAETSFADTRMNDGKTDRQGRFWAGTMFEAEGKTPQAIGALYRLDSNLACHQVAKGFTCCNGLAWSPDSRTLYLADSATSYVWAWDFDPATGAIERQRVFIDLTSEQGVCDGATVDEQGCYWLTIPFKGKIQRYDPDGKLMRTIKLPVDTPTCCEFGGPNLDILYVTTGTLERTPAELKDQPWAGGLLAIDVGVKGLSASAFSG